MTTPRFRGPPGDRARWLVPMVVGVVLLLLVPASTFGSRSSSQGPNSSGAKPPVARSPAFGPTIVKSSKYDWPELHQSPALTGYASNSPLSSLTAPTLGVGWASNLYGTALDSPVVAYDPLLGETLVYIGTDAGNFVAVNLANGHIVWGIWLGSPIRASPLVHNGSVFVVPFLSAEMFKLNASTGATQCSTDLPGSTEATPTFASPPGGVPTLYLGTEAPSPRSGPYLAINAGSCSIEWEFSGYNQTAGSWDASSYIVNATGVPMVLFGTDDPDSSVYALNALTGQLIWRFQCYNPVGKDYDVGAGPTISAPGRNGFSQGVVYATNSAGIAYALDLNNGTLIWETDFFAIAGLTGTVEPRARSTPALEGTDLIFGFNQGLVNLDAQNGQVRWFYNDSARAESIAAPAIAGASSHSIVVTGDIGGSLDVLARTTGALLYSYQTGGWIASSPAVSDGNILIASSDGFLYDFIVGGGNDAQLPGTSISSPLPGAAVSSPHGNLKVFGNATDPLGVAAVEVAIQSGGSTGPWWDAATHSWATGAINNRATLRAPRATSTSWSVSFPVPAAGGSYSVTANTESISGQSDTTGTTVDFSVNYSTSGAYLRASSEYVAPGGSLTINGGGFGASVSVTIGLAGRTLATATSGTNGSLPPTSVVIPNNATFGPTSVTAMAHASEKSSSTTITVANTWDQLGDEPAIPASNRTTRPCTMSSSRGTITGSRSRGGMTPGPPSMPRPRSWMGERTWAIRTGTSSRSISSTGASCGISPWPRGRPSTEAPRWIPGTDWCSLEPRTGPWMPSTYRTGRSLGRTRSGGIVAAPVFANGELYVTSSTGLVEALSESSGMASWSLVLGSAASSAPSLNASAHLLVVGLTNGTVFGLNDATGATKWSFATGGAVTAPALVTRSTVLVGSTDHFLYDLAASTGALEWSFQTGGAIQEHRDGRQLAPLVPGVGRRLSLHPELDQRCGKVQLLYRVADRGRSQHHRGHRIRGRGWHDRGSEDVR